MVAQGGLEALTGLASIAPTRLRGPGSLCHTAIVSPRNRALLFVILLAVLTGAAVWGVVWYRGRPVPTARLLKRLPTGDALVVYVDFAQLRRGGALQCFGRESAAIILHLDRQTTGFLPT